MVTSRSVTEGEVILSAEGGRVSGFADTAQHPYLRPAMGHCNVSSAWEHPESEAAARRGRILLIAGLVFERWFGLAGSSDGKSHPADLHPGRRGLRAMARYFEVGAVDGLLPSIDLLPEDKAMADDDAVLMYALQSNQQQAADERPQALCLVREAARLAAEALEIAPGAPTDTSDAEAEDRFNWAWSLVRSRVYSAGGVPAAGLAAAARHQQPWTKQLVPGEAPSWPNRLEPLSMLFNDHSWRYPVNLVRSIDPLTRFELRSDGRMIENARENLAVGIASVAGRLHPRLPGVPIALPKGHPMRISYDGDGDEGWQLSCVGQKAWVG